jgi:hypothetical protein
LGSVRFLPSRTGSCFEVRGLHWCRPRTHIGMNCRTADLHASEHTVIPEMHSWAGGETEACPANPSTSKPCCDTCANLCLARLLPVISTARCTLIQVLQVPRSVLARSRSSLHSRGRPGAGKWQWPVLPTGGGSFYRGKHRGSGRGGEGIRQGPTPDGSFRPRWM